MWQFLMCRTVIVLLNTNKRRSPTLQELSKPHPVRENGHSVVLQLVKDNFRRANCSRANDACVVH